MHRRKRDFFTLAMLVLGVGIVAIFPFGLLNGVVVGAVHRFLCGLFGSKHLEHPLLSCWEVAAILWSLIYGILFYLYKFPRDYAAPLREKIMKLGASTEKEREKLAKQISRLQSLGMLMALVIALLAVGAWYVFSSPHLISGTVSGFNRILAEALIIASFAITDGFLAFRGEAVGETREIKQDYRGFLFGVDIPGLIGFAVVLTYLLFVGRIVGPDKSDFLDFVAGASAMNLLLVNIAFAFSYFKTGGVQQPT